MEICKNISISQNVILHVPLFYLFKYTTVPHCNPPTPLHIYHTPNPHTYLTFDAPTLLHTPSHSIDDPLLHFRLSHLTQLKQSPDKSDTSPYSKHPPQYIHPPPPTPTIKYVNLNVAKIVVIFTKNK